MHPMIPEIEQHRDEIIAICEEFGVERLYVFGSATTDAFDPASSDLDLLVLYPDEYDYGPFGERYLELKHRLESLVGRRVDLVMGRNLRNPVFIESLEATRRLLYAA
jgi:predicted nucleotidyltransferase